MSNKITIALLGIPLALSAGLSGAAETVVQSTAPFSDVTTAAGLKFNRESYGAAWGDFDGNIYPDLVVNNHREKPGLYTGSGAGTFTNVALINGIVAEWQSHALADTHGGTWADVNNDGWQDIFMSIGRNGNNTQQILINETGASGKRVLRMRDDEWGINPATNSKIKPFGGRTPIWVDYDYDGSMDMMLASYGGPVPILHQEFSSALNRSQLVDKTSAMGFDCQKVQYGFMLDVYTPPPAAAGANNFKPELFCSGEGKFPGGVYETSVLVQRTRGAQTYMGFNPIGFKAEIFPTPTSATRSTVSTISSVADSAVGDFNNDGLQDLIMVRGSSRPSGSNFARTSDGKYSLELLVQNGEKGVQFYVANDTFMLDIDWNKDSNDEGFRDPPLYIGGKGGVVKNIGYPQSTKTLLQKRNTVTYDLPFHHYIEISPALNLAEFEGEPYRNPALIPYFQLWFEYDSAGKRKWFFRHYGDQIDPTGASRLTYGAGFARVQSIAAMTAGATKNGARVFDTGQGGTEKPMLPTLLLQQRRANANGSTQGVFVQPTVAGSLKEKVQCISVTTGDFDNDGDVDFYVACRGPAANITNYLYQNQLHNTDGLPTGQPIFNRVKVNNGSAPGAAGAEGPVGLAITDHAGTGDSVVTADYDLDGYLDLFVTNGYNMRPKNAGGPYRLFHNDGKSKQLSLFGKSNNWIQLDLVGAGTAASKTTKDAYGARVYIVEGGNRVMMREKNGGYHRWSQDHQRLHFGLGQRNAVNVEVIWPNGVVNRFDNVATNHLYRVAQTGAALTQLK